MVYTDFNIAVLPDTQYYSAYWPTIFEQQVQWVCGCFNRVPFDFVTHLGDIVEHGVTIREWQIARYALTCLVDNDIPFGFTVGNHDNYDTSPIYDDGSDFLMMNDVFHSIIDHKRSTSDITFYNLTHGYENNLEKLNEDLIIIHLAWSFNNDVRDWAIDQIHMYNESKVILVSHWALSDCNNKVSSHITHILGRTNNIILVLSGHKFSCGGENMVTYHNSDGIQIPIVTQDYQARDHGGTSWTRIVQFTESTDVEDICFYTYNIAERRYETDEDSYLWFTNQTFIEDRDLVREHCSLDLNERCAFSYDQGAIFLFQLFSYTLYMIGLFISVYRLSVI